MTLSKQGYTLGKIDIAEVDMYEYMLGKKNYLDGSLVQSRTEEG
ncbi:hypothetical protein PTHTG4_00160 [Parageobacillus thermoglucosidasius]|nr:hypothetical protein [Parageobacillus thermoglucosidasius]GCD80954.1 hypothetical protein PTHTG4_00160 [Parageobacillus thermoglucosidasius]